MSKDFRIHRHYPETAACDDEVVLTVDSGRALYMAEVITLSTAIQLRALSKVLDRLGNQPYDKPLTSEDSDDILAVKDALDGLSEDLRYATSAISEGKSIPVARRLEPGV